MQHIVKMVHKLTEDQSGMYLSCEENGNVVLVSDLKKNGSFHPLSVGSAVLSSRAEYLFDAATQEYLIGFTPGGQSEYSGTFWGADNAPCGNIASVGVGSERYYEANIYGNRFECYMWAVGTSPCMMCYKNGVQKAMLVEDKLSVNQCFSMTMHIIDDEDLLALCMLGLIYHQFENVRRMNSTFHRAFVVNGWSMAFCKNAANYHFEVPVYGIGKSKYDAGFLKQFYLPEYYPYQDEKVTVRGVVKEMGTGFREAAGEAWTEEKLKTSLKDPVAIALIAGCPILIGIIGGFIGPSALLQMGIDIYAYSSGVRFLIGFLIFFVIIGLGEGLFLLFFKWLTTVFGKKE